MPSAIGRPRLGLAEGEGTGSKGPAVNSLAPHLILGKLMKSIKCPAILAQVWVERNMSGIRIRQAIVEYSMLS